MTEFETELLGTLYIIDGTVFVATVFLCMICIICCIIVGIKIGDVLSE